jgi:hypothetical protein
VACRRHRRRKVFPGGRGTEARVTVVNREKSEAIPVQVLNEMVAVNITGAPVVRIDPETAPAVKATAVRQQWEYRTLRLDHSNDPASQLNSAGNEGWELVTAIAAGPGQSFLVLKRPR